MGTDLQTAVATVKKLSRKAERLGPALVHPWLPADASAAFICCIGAGPWKYGRRRKVQLVALQKLAGRDLIELTGREKWFPLDWQNEMLNALTMTLKRHWISMGQAISVLRQWTPIEGARPNFYRMCGRPKGTKVLSLFLRDYVGVPSFPVDRHVKRALQALELPHIEERILDVCDEAEIDPVPVARLMIHGQLDGGNPDWTNWPARPAPETPRGN